MPLWHSHGGDPRPGHFSMSGTRATPGFHNHVGITMGKKSFVLPTTGMQLCIRILFTRAQTRSLPLCARACVCVCEFDGRWGAQGVGLSTESGAPQLYWGAPRHGIHAHRADPGRPMASDIFSPAHTHARARREVGGVGDPGVLGPATHRAAPADVPSRPPPNPMVRRNLRHNLCCVAPALVLRLVSYVDVPKTPASLGKRQGKGSSLGVSFGGRGVGRLGAVGSLRTSKWALGAYGLGRMLAGCCRCTARAGPVEYQHCHCCVPV